MAGLDLEQAGVAYDADHGIRVDDFFRTRNRRIDAAGDVCLEPRFTSVACASARIAIVNALFLRSKRFSSLTIPRYPYTDPEIAHVGLYVRQARQRGIPVKTFTVSMHDVDRAISDQRDLARDRRWNEDEDTREGPVCVSDASGGDPFGDGSIPGHEDNFLSALDGSRLAQS